jgi:hypothetical protein
MELHTSKVAGGIFIGLDFIRPEGTVSSTLSHLALWTPACMERYAFLPFSLLSAGGQNNILRVIISFSPAFISHLAKGKFPPADVKNCI